MNRSKPPIVVEETFNRPRQVVWDAITVRDQMIEWYFEQIQEFEPVVGFETAFSVDSGGRSFLHQWKVNEVIPGKKISYEWAYPEYPGEAYVVFELKTVQQGTRLQLSCFGIESFPQNIPEFSRENCRAGWNYFIKDRLKTYLTENPGPYSE